MNINEILEQNIQWQDKKIPSLGYALKRDMYLEIRKELSSHFIITISGLRRTGKSVLQSQLCEEFLQSQTNIPIKNFLRFSFEREDDLDLLPSSELRELIHLYFKEVLKVHPQTTGQKILIALDEIQNVKNWQSIIKYYYDLNPDIKFILTGSSALYLSDSVESLAGRSLDYEIECLSFREFLRFTEQEEKFHPILESKNFENFVPFFITSDIVAEFEKFIMLGGFPDSAIMSKEGKSVAEIQSFIWNSIILKIIRKDLRKYFNFKESLPDQRLFEICCAESGSFLEVQNLASEVGLSLPTIKTHLDAFLKSKLISFLSKFDRKLRREIKATRKLYVSSPCLIYATARKQSTEDRSFLGHAIETYAFNRLSKYGKIFVDRGKESKDEVDFYLADKGLLVECKYSTKIDARSFKYIRTRSRELGVPYLVLTRDTWTTANLSCIPAFLL